MHYEPIKHSIDRYVSRYTWIKKIFFRLLDVHLLRTWHIHRELKTLCRNFDGDFKVLDAGCGFGQYSWYIARKFSKSCINGVDISESHILKARDFFTRAGYPGFHFETADLTRFSKPNEYDLVVSVDVMEHILEDEKVFENFYHSLKPGGFVLINTPSDQGGSDVHHEEDKSFIDEHVRDGYGVEDITLKLHKAGFRNVNARYTYGVPGKISWKLSMKLPITLLNKSKIFVLVLPFYFLLVYPFVLLLNYMDVHSGHITGTGLMVTAQK
jgi:SAM-dependent methyltransferase